MNDIDQFVFSALGGLFFGAWQKNVCAGLFCVIVLWMWRFG